jgi:hypothetical protein
MLHKKNYPNRTVSRAVSGEAHIKGAANTTSDLESGRVMCMVFGKGQVCVCAAFEAGAAWIRPAAGRGHLEFGKARARE